jgi:hypothetical protein
VNYTEPDPTDLRSALATLVAQEPDLPSGTADIERRGRRQLARRRWGGAVATAFVVAAAGVAAVNLNGTGGPEPHVALPPTATTSDPAGTGLAEGFPIGSAVDAVASALPSGASLGELPMDIAWQEGGLLDVPVITAAGAVTVTIQVAEGRCAATASPVDGLTAADLTAVADAVCAEWTAGGSLPVIPAGQPGDEQPDLAAR